MDVIRFWKNLKQAAAPATSITSSGSPFRLALTYYSSDGNAMNMPLACLSAYAKREIPNIEVRLFPIIHDHNDPMDERYTVDGFTRQVSAFRPNLVAASCMSPHWEPMQPYFQALHSRLPETPLIIGGYQAILSPDETLAADAVTYVCVGDGEEPLIGLIRKLMANSAEAIPGLWEKSGQRNVVKSAPVLSEDLTVLPFPDYTIYEDQDGNLGPWVVSAYSKKGLPVMSGRGCPYRCTYCNNTVMLKQYRGQGSYLRKYNPERLVEELARLRDRYGVNLFEFWDELFLFDVRYVYRLLDLYAKRIGLPFSISARVEFMDEEFFKVAYAAGCRWVSFGLESGSEIYRNSFLGRKMSNQQILAAAENARKVGINRLTFNIVGMPFETRENMLETLRINEAIQPEFFAFFLYLPLRGTPLYDLAKEKGLLLPDSSSDYHLDDRPRLNLKEHEGGATNEELGEVVAKMREFQQTNNRIDLYMS